MTPRPRSAQGAVKGRWSNETASSARFWAARPSRRASTHARCSSRRRAPVRPPDDGTKATAQMYPPGNSPRTIRLDPVPSMRSPVLEMGVASAAELDELDAAALGALPAAPCAATTGHPAPSAAPPRRGRLTGGRPPRPGRPAAWCAAGSDPVRRGPTRGTSEPGSQRQGTASAEPGPARQPVARPRARPPPSARNTREHGQYQRRTAGTAPVRPPSPPGPRSRHPGPPRPR